MITTFGTGYTGTNAQKICINFRKLACFEHDDSIVWPSSHVDCWPPYIVYQWIIVYHKYTSIRWVGSNICQVPKWGVYDGCGVPCQDDDERWCGCSNEAMVHGMSSSLKIWCMRNFPSPMPFFQDQEGLWKHCRNTVEALWPWLCRLSEDFQTELVLKAKNALQCLGFI